MERAEAEIKCRPDDGEVVPKALAQGVNEAVGAYQEIAGRSGHGGHPTSSPGLRQPPSPEISRSAAGGPQVPDL